MKSGIESSPVTSARLARRMGGGLRVLLGYGKSATWIVLILLMCLIGCQTQEGTDESDADDAPSAPVPVKVAVARKTTLRPSITVVGTLIAIPERTATVSPQIGGWIAEIQVVEGARVQAGQQLLHLDSRVARAALTRSQANVQQKAAVVTRLKRGYLPQEIEMARQEAQQAQQSLAALRTEFNALDPLRDRNEVSQVKYETLASKLRAAEATAKAATAKQELLEAGTRPEQITEAEADLAVATAERDAANLNLDFCSVTSPIAGVVTQLSARRGTFVERATVVATIVDIDHLFAKFRVPSAYLGQIHHGQHVDVRLASSSDTALSGTLDRISGRADPATGQIDAFAQFANPDQLLCPGLACRVTVWLPEIADALVIPTSAVADRSGTPVVTVIRDNKAYEIEVELAASTTTEVQVVDGLTPGDTVVTQGGYGLPDGCPVRFVKASASETSSAIPK